MINIALGAKMGVFTVLNLAGKKSNGAYSYSCLCDCGVTAQVPAASLIKGKKHKGCPYIAKNWPRSTAKRLGLPKYTPDKPCKRGHLEKFTENGACVECAAARARTDEAVERRKVWYESRKSEECKTRTAAKAEKRATFHALPDETKKELLRAANNKRCATWRKKHPTVFLERTSVYKKELRSGYVKRVLLDKGFEKDQITEDLIALQREATETRRIRRQLIKTLKELK